MTQPALQSVALALLLATTAASATQGISSKDFQDGRASISAEYKSGAAACGSEVGNVRDICRAEATGRRNVARAELQERYQPGNQATYNVSAAKARAAYAVAREKCDDLSYGDKQGCMKETRATETRALAEAKSALPAAAPSAASPSKKSASQKEELQDYVDDSVITARVKAAVFQEPSLKSAEINVETRKGIVQLSGFVQSRASIDRAVEVSRSIRGVASVKNVMIVKGQQ